QPRTKHTINISRMRKVGGTFHETSVCAMKAGVPSAENTAPKNVDATSRIITMLDVCTVRNTESLKTVQLSRPCAAVTSNDPAQPRAAPSVGVAQPETIEPKVTRISTAGGIRPRKNSRTSTLAGTSSSSSDSGGPSFGLRHTR